MSDQHSDPQRPPQDGSVPPPAPWGSPVPGSRPTAGQPSPGQPHPGGYAGGYPQQPGYPGPPAGQGFPQQQGYGQPQGYPAPQPRPSALGGLADLGFRRRITPGLAKIVYVAVVVLAVLTAIVSVIGAFSAFGTAGHPFVGGGQWILFGLLLLVSGPLGGFVLLAFARFWLEYFLDRATEASGDRPH